MTQEYWVVLAGIIGAVVVLAWLIFWDYRKRILEHEERRLMIERGLTPPEPVATGWPAVRAREAELRFQERRLLIEKGVDPGDEHAVGHLTGVVPRRRPLPSEGYLRSGLVAIAVGLGLLAPSGVIRWSGAVVSADSQNFVLFLAVISPLVALYGIANVMYYGLAKNRASEAASPNSPDSRSGS